MTGMILAAGLGTRLRPLTNTVPKALVEVNGVPLLERVVQRVLAAGAERLVFNVSYLGEKVEDYIRERGGWGVKTAISWEPDGPLETGGGLKKAFLDDLFPDGDSVLVHNADILTTIDLAALVRAHEADAEEPYATLAVTPAASDRYLAFDEGGLLGYALEAKETHMREPLGEVTRYDFCGVHVVSPKMLEVLAAEDGDKFSVMDNYLRLSKARKYVAAFENGHECLDVGTHERLAEAEKRFGDAL